jgi:phosphoribosylformylglycinamidine synthase
MIDEKLKTYRINRAEYQKICDLLGRPPEGVEWALFSALWSEHCSYKSSKVHLKKLFSTSSRVLQSFGENAGVIDLGEGEKIAFKMESHNHPSFIEPYQGAATGVGGILRDIFTMGARPISLANFLCFGNPSAKRMSRLVEGVVAGISGYGNCVGVPTITGQTEFHSSYDTNILVNALAVGYFGKKDPVVTSVASGEGNLVVYVGAKTGRDGVHGASMASESFDESSASKRPTVQIGDPFFEKLLIESCLEVIRADLVVAIQDMGAAGLTSSSFEMAAKGNVGFEIHLDKVPLRDPTMGPEEILLSESQERMLLVCEPSKLKAIEEVFSRWGLDATAIGRVFSERRVRLFWKGEVISDLDPHLLTENAPQYERPFEVWTSPKKVERLGDLPALNETDGLLENTKKTLESVQGCSRRWIYRQYDQRVGALTARDCSSSVGVQRLPESGRALGLVLGCRPYVMRLDARLGGMDSVYEPALQLAAKGFEPLAVTDCLNYGNPEKPSLMSEFVASVQGMSQACESLKAPIISGNVSFYNETEGKNITSTPSTGMVGLRERIALPKEHLQNAGDEVFLIRLPMVSTWGQQGELMERLEFCGELDPDRLSLFVKDLWTWTKDLGVEVSTRVVGKFGLLYALARFCSEEVGIRTQNGPWAQAPQDWFKENFYEVLFSAPLGSFSAENIKSRFSVKDVQVWKIGEAVSGQIELEGRTFSLTDLSLMYETGWRTHFEKLS